MSEFKGTPGPWEVADRHDGFPFGAWNPTVAKSDVDMLCRFDPPYTEISTANARLIAAAPELLEALQAFIARYDSHAMKFDDAVRKARAAIAKALGETI